MIRLPGTDWLILSHPLDGWAQNTSAFPRSVCTKPSSHPGRCNMTIWGSKDSAAEWVWLAQVEADPHEDAAYSALLPLNHTHVYLVYERAGYFTITGRAVALDLAGAERRLRQRRQRRQRRPGMVL